MRRLRFNPDLIYPVGSIYFSVNNVNPSIYFGGTWVSWGPGRVPVGVDISQAEFETVEKVGGSKYLQQHAHPILTNPNQGDIPGASVFSEGGGNGFFKDMGALSVYAGEGNSGNLQPYITCYMWKRTA